MVGPEGLECCPPPIVLKVPHAEPEPLDSSGWKSDPRQQMMPAHEEVRRRRWETNLANLKELLEAGMDDRSSLLSVTAVLYFATGLGYSLGSIPFHMHLIRTRTFPELFGIRFYAGGFIERLGGIDAVILGSWAFIVLGILFIPAAFWLWGSMKAGAILALALFPFAMFVSVGFLAPGPMVVEPAKVILVLIAWNSLR